jgi:hypothetical protein
VMIAYRDYTQVMVRTSPDEAGSARARLRELRADYESRFRRLIDELRLPEGIDRRYLRLFLIGGLNWSQVWYHPNGDSPETVAQRFVDLLRTRLELP